MISIDKAVQAQSKEKDVFVIHSGQVRDVKIDKIIIYKADDVRVYVTSVTHGIDNAYFPLSKIYRSLEDCTRNFTTYEPERTRITLD